MTLIVSVHHVYINHSINNLHESWKCVSYQFFSNIFCFLSKAKYDLWQNRPSSEDTHYKYCSTKIWKSLIKKITCLPKNVRLEQRTSTIPRIYNLRYIKPSSQLNAKMFGFSIRKKLTVKNKVISHHIFWCICKCTSSI